VSEVDQSFLLDREANVIGAIAFIRDHWKQAAKAGRTLVVTIAEWDSKRTSRANRKYWAQLREISEQVNVHGRHFSAYVWHKHFAGAMLGFEDMPDGSTVPMSTRNLKVKEFDDYRKQVESHAVSELNVRFSQ
jgi:hypothetical protein